MLFKIKPSIFGDKVNKFIKNLDEISIKDIPLVGGKTASLGEMYKELRSQGINIPPGFAITSDGFSAVINSGMIVEKIDELLKNLDTRDISKLSNVGKQIRELIVAVKLPERLATEIIAAYKKLSLSGESVSVAVRSSATTEDLPTASFAGQQETFLNIQGETALLQACSKCFASLFTDRAISYRITKGFKDIPVKLSIFVQKMVRADLGTSGVIFTLEPESGARNVILVSSAYGLGENIVGGKVNPDEFLVQKDLIGKVSNPILRKKIGMKQHRLVYSTQGAQTTQNITVSRTEQGRQSISDEEIILLATWAKVIDNHYSKINNKEMPMDIEWAKDGNTNELFILQARPETVHSTKKTQSATNFTLIEKSKKLLTGQAVGSAVGTGRVKIIKNVKELANFKVGDILVADMTDPDWEPVMVKASAIITNKGGRTCHAAIISREHGVPCLVGTTSATTTLKDEQPVTVSCSQGEIGFVYEGILKYTQEEIDLSKVPQIKTKVFVNIGNPDEAFKIAQLPVNGVGLTRIEFIITNSVKVHPMALIHFTQLADETTRKSIREILGPNEDDPRQFFINKLAEGIATIAGAFYPRPVIVRFSDFKSNEYANLLGGSEFEIPEENPMLGFRGASRYYHKKYKEAFALECFAIKKVREEMGLRNVKVMIPFCRNVKEGKLVLTEMAKSGLIKGENGLEVYVMAELPSNILEANEFAKIFDGFSIGSNDLTQMVLGVDRDSAILGELFDERDPAVLKMMQMLIQAVKQAQIPVGICGQAPSDYPEITQFLVKQGIHSISVTSDSILKTINIIHEVEQGLIQKKQIN